MNTATTSKQVPDLRKGDIVRAHGGRFQVIEHAHSVGSVGRYADTQGPSPVAAASSVCLEGAVPGYFAPGSIWNFQGNRLATERVEVV